MKVLIKFRHGLGDAVQFTVVLKHLRKHRPDWTVFVKALRGKHSAMHGLCERVWHDGEKSPPDSDFDRTFDLYWYENYNRYRGRSNSKVTNCLEEVFRIPYDPALGRYQVDVRRPFLDRADSWLASVGCGIVDGRRNAFLLHYQGNTAQHRKNLTHEEALLICESASSRGLIPVVLDWDNRSLIADGKTVFTPPVGEGDLWGGFGSGDAEALTALILRASLFAGIDSGPQKCAAATDTPSVGLWTGHHPIQFFDPSPNFLHLIPTDWRAMPPCDDPLIATWFEENHAHRTYSSLTEEFDKVAEAMLGPSSAPKKDGLVHVGGFMVPAFKPEQSAVIVTAVHRRDEYKTALRPRRHDEEYVVDVGAGFGAFSRLWQERNPKANAAAVECCPDMIPALEHNVGWWATVIEAACTYEPDDVGLLSAFHPAGQSVGGSKVRTFEEMKRERKGEYRWDSAPLRKITLEQVLERVGFPFAHVLKLDCEGSEFSILENCDLSRVHTIFAESHDPDRWRSLLRSRFQGWDVGHMSPTGKFEIWHLINPDWRHG